MDRIWSTAETLPTFEPGRSSWNEIEEITDSHLNRLDDWLPWMGRRFMDKIYPVNEGRPAPFGEQRRSSLS
jgi:hypothetical protein